MTTSELIRANLSSVRKEIAEVYPHLNDEMLDWAPAEGMRTIHGQFVEILSTERGILEKLRGLPRRPNEETDAEFWAVKTVAGLVAKANEVRQATLDFLDSLDEAGLNADAGMSDGFADWVDLKPVPVAEMLRYIARHESYHAGQLVSYLWAKGDNPYTWD